jgi:phosphoribosylglycinamide formyltransferase 1
MEQSGVEPSRQPAPLRVGVLVSGRGSNLQALLDCFPSEHPLARIVCVVGNRDCAALEHARRFGVRAHLVARDDHPSRRQQQAAMAALLADAGVDLVVLAGFDQIVSAALLAPYAGRILNIHPSLLPAFGGTLHAQADALRHGVKVSGCTVHFVTADLDGGPIIAQAAVPVHDDDGEASLAQRILAHEHRLLPEVVRWIAEGRVRIEGRRVRIASPTPD